MNYSIPERTKTRTTAVIIVAFLFAMIGCSDLTGPAAPLGQEPIEMRLAGLEPQLRDASDAFVRAVEDRPVRTRAEIAVNRLGEQLLFGKVASSRLALAEARTLLADLDDISAIEVAPVILALDYIERRINQIAGEG